MSLIQCPDCKKMISESAVACPQCGLRLNPEIIKNYKIDHPEPDETINCPACSRQISKFSEKCKHCGADLSPEGPQNQKTEHPSFLATVKCPNCNKRISAQAQKCKYCSTDIPADKMLALQKNASKGKAWGCVAIIILFIIIFGTGKCKGDGTAKARPKKTESHQVIESFEDKTPVSYKYFVSLMVRQDIPRKELEALLFQYLDIGKGQNTAGKKLIVQVAAYTDSLRYQNGIQWLGILNLNEFTSETPDLKFDEVNLVDGDSRLELPKDDKFQGMEDVFFDISNHELEASLINEHIYGMDASEQILFMNNDQNRSRFLKDEGRIEEKLLAHYLQKHKLTRQQFEELRSEGKRRNWTQKPPDVIQTNFPYYRKTLNL